MEKYCNNTWKDVVKVLHSNIDSGLSETECDDRRKVYGDNSIKLPSISVNFKNIMRIYLLIQILSCVVLFLNKQIVMSLIVLIIFLINIITKIITTYKKNKKLSFLQKINNTTTTVLRSNSERIIKSSELVKGDIVYFQKGSLIAADLRIIEAEDLMVDEKNLTGETFYKNKFESKISGYVSSIGEMTNILFKGSIIREGSGMGIVVETGDNTQLGKVLSMLYHSTNNKSSLSNLIEKRFSNILIMMLFISMISLPLGILFYKTFDNFLICLFAITILPLNLLILIISNILKRDLLKDKIELINISTLNLINEVELIFLDKVGSITESNMYLSKIYCNDTIINSNEVNYDEDICVKRIIDTVLLSNNATYNVDSDSGIGDLAEVAYLRFAAKHKIYKSIIDSKHPRIFDIPMESEEQIFTTVNRYKSGYRANVKGSVDSLLKKCTHIMIEGEERIITEEDIEKIKAVHYNLSIEGLYIQAVSYRNFSYMPTPSENIECNLVFVGLIALKNPFIKDIDKDISEIKNRGMIPILFTEDNIIAASTIGKKAGFIYDNSGVISGVELDSLTSEELKNTLEKVKVFCKVTPELKNKIVGTYVKANYKVAASGETLSDLSSLGAAKVAIGKGDAPIVVKKICDVFIKDNYLKGFVSLFDVSKRFMLGLYEKLYYFIIIALSEIFIINMQLLIKGKDEINYMMILFTNIFIFIPLTIVSTNSDTYIPKIKKFVFRCLLWIVILTVSNLFLESNYGICTFLTLGAIIIQNYIMKCQKKYLNVCMICLSTFILIMGTILISILYNFKLSIMSMVVLVISLIISILFELFIKKRE